MEVNFTLFSGGISSSPGTSPRPTSDFNSIEALCREMGFTFEYVCCMLAGFKTISIIDVRFYQQAPNFAATRGKNSQIVFL